MTDDKDALDGRELKDWESRYPPKAQVEYYLEALYLSILLFSCITLIFITWNGWLSNFLKIPPEKVATFIKFAYYSAAGMIGGITFDMKHLYRSVAREWWHQDRRLWRILSPFIAMSVAFSIGNMIESSLMIITNETSGSTYISIGFLSGYFADRAVGKLSEIAKVLFGENSETNPKKKNDAEKRE